MSNRQLSEVLSCWVFLLVSGEENRQEVYCTSWQLSHWSRQEEIKTPQTNQKTAVPYEEKHQLHENNKLKKRFSRSLWRQNKRPHHNTAKKIHISSWRNICHLMRRNLSALLSTGRTLALCPVWEAWLVWCKWEESRGEQPDTREQKHMSCRNTLKKISWAIEEKPEIWHMHHFRPEKTQKILRVSLLFSK